MSNDYIAGSLDDIAYVRMVVKYNGKFVLCYNKKVKKWDCVGGRVENGENPLAAAKRELFEETGAVDFDIVPVRDYKRFLEDGTFYNNNREYFVNVHKFSDIPDGSEMEKIDFFDEIPDDFLYENERKTRLEHFKRIEKYASAYWD